MVTVKAPNGAVMELDDTVASGLIGGVDSEWSIVEPDTKARPKK